jgi:hypothetical protein
VEVVKEGRRKQAVPTLRRRAERRETGRDVIVFS